MDISQNKEVVYKGDIICARCVHREICRFGDVLDTGKCEEFKRDWNVIYKRVKK